MPNQIHFTFRMEEDMYADLKLWATQEERSLHNLMVWILKQALTTHNKGDLT